MNRAKRAAGSIIIVLLMAGSTIGVWVTIAGLITLAHCATNAR